MVYNVDQFILSPPILVLFAFVVLRVVVSLSVDVSQGAAVQGLYAQSVLGFVRR